MARGRHWITFSGTAEQVGRAFHTGIHRYRVNGETHFANAIEPSVPADLDTVVVGIRGLNDFRPKSQYIRPKPEFNSTDGTHRIVPDDFATIYDIQRAYNIGIDGTGQKIAIAGRTDIDINDIRTFRKMFNLPANDPQVKLFGPDPGTNADDLVEKRTSTSNGRAQWRETRRSFMRIRTTSRRQRNTRSIRDWQAGSEL